MTCIIGLKQDDCIYMGADSAIGVYGLVVQGLDKIKRFKNCLIGFSGLKSVQNLMEERSSLFDGDWSVGHLNDIWRSLAECTPSGNDSEMLIAAGSNLYWMGNHGSHRFIYEEFETIGSGAQIAKGAMEALADVIQDPEQRIMKSLEITARFCNGVSEPFYVEKFEA